MKRRDFLRSTGWFVVGASLSGIPGCGDNSSPPDGALPEEVGTYAFPQGVASGDPRPDSVVLWTRAVLAGSSDANFGLISLRVQVAADASFSKLLVDDAVTAANANDHTVRVLITGLGASTNYFYRFVAGQDSVSGRTRTAPGPQDNVQVNLAWVSCQDFSAGHYGAYRQLLVDDDKRPEADKIHAVIHLGDMIYETRADGFQTAINENFEPIMLVSRDGTPRAIPEFPSGGGVRAGVTFAATVDDYRFLYKTFLSDPDLQAARARWPFVSVWDDHEFTDDCWQSQANYTNAATADEGDQTRRVAASQAWFEYIPVQLSGSVGVEGVASEASDFVAPVGVKDAAFTSANADNFVPEPNNVAAVGAITIYRSLRFGKHVELVMTDERSYRSDHAIPEEISGSAPFLAPRNALPITLVNVLDAGSAGNDGHPQATIPLGTALVPNVRAGSPPGTMLGKKQKAWWKATMKASDATWKLWGNEVTLMRLALARLAPDGKDLCVAADAWDGYDFERKELMSFLRTEAIKNVVVLSGDVHASFAGTVVDDFNAPAAMQVPVACELVASGISSNSLFSFFEAASRGGDPALRALITVDAGATKFVENFNLLLLNGPVAAGTYAATKSLPIALDPSRNLNPNPHLKYADTNAQGYGYVKVNGTQVAASIITINRPVVSPPPDAGPGIKRTVSFTIPKDNPGGMTGPTVTGVKPFPLT